MDPWILANFIIFSYSVYVNLKRAKKTNPRRALRIAAAVASLYVVFIYFLVLIGGLQEFEVRFYMRWFQFPIAVIFIAEAING